MDKTTALLVILTLCIVINAGVMVVLVLLIRQWKRLIKIVEEKVLHE